MAAQDNHNKVTNSTEKAKMADMCKEQECEDSSASQREAGELSVEGPQRYEYYVTKERALRHLTDRIVSGIDSMTETIEMQDGLIAELETERNGLEFGIVMTRIELSNLKKKLKERRLRYRKLLRRNKYIQCLLNEEKSLLAELTKLKK